MTTSRDGGNIELRYRPDQERNEKGQFKDEDIPNPSGANELKVKGFRNKQKLNNHWLNGRTHQKEYMSEGILNAHQYERRAVELLESPVGGNIVGHIDKENNIIRYDILRNDFVKGNIKKGITTMFKPVDKRLYYEKQKEEDLKYGGKA